MKCSFCFLLLLILHASSYAQTAADSVWREETVGQKASFRIPAAWTCVAKEGKKPVYAWTYNRTAYKLKSGKSISPSLSCVVEPATNADIRQYSTASLGFFKSLNGFKILKVITHSDGVLQIPYAIGYWATYTDAANVPHRLMIVHALNHGTGLKFFIDVPEESFPALEEEITAIVHSLRFL